MAETTDNTDQICLTKWITAGLLIPEVKLLHGDAGYLLCNMIAKYSLASNNYHVSSRALEQLMQDNFDIDATHNRAKFYGRKKLYIYEHPVPARLTREELLRCNPSETNVREILRQSGPVTILLRTEDARLTQSGLRHIMPTSWKWGDNVFARYDAARIEISKIQIKMSGKLRR